MKKHHKTTFLAKISVQKITISSSIKWRKPNQKLCNLCSDKLGKKYQKMVNSFTKPTSVCFNQDFRPFAFKGQRKENISGQRPIVSCNSLIYSIYFIYLCQALSHPNRFCSRADQMISAPYALHFQSYSKICMHNLELTLCPRCLG